MKVGFVAGLLYQTTSVLTKFTLQTDDSPYTSAHLFLSPSGGASTSAPEGAVLEVTSGRFQCIITQASLCSRGPIMAAHLGVCSL